MAEEHRHLPDATAEAIDADEEKLESSGLSSKELQTRREALRQVRQFGDPVLRSEARVIEDFSDHIRAQAERMIHLMEDAYGIGLAAPQIGISNRLLVYRVGDSPPVVLANPVIEWNSDDEEAFEEGCLSLANVHVDVDRAIHVRVTGQDAFGDRIKIEASGLNARVIQHEMDHLDGILILDRASKDQRKAALRALREAEESAGYAA
ncbi:MAG: peptide deformylase [Thermoleophilaceae bacterium]|nr:peptide deformylase [Thermoleophilaceae bacterium]